MKRIIYFSTLVFLLCSNPAFASKKWETSLFLGSYRPSFSTFNDEWYDYKLRGGTVYGCALDYRITAYYRVRLQLDFFDFKSGGRRRIYEREDFRLKAVTISVLGLLNLFRYQNYKMYAGIGFVDHQIKTWVPSYFLSPSSSTYNFGFPVATVVLIGIATPLKQSHYIKGEIQYVAGSDGRLYDIPLDWDGFKFLMSLGIKF